MYKPGLRSFEAADFALAGTGRSAPFAEPRAGVPLGSRKLPSRRLDLAVDLGADIGSRRWWQGMATLIALLAVAIYVAVHPVRLPAAVPPPLTEAQLGALEANAIQPLADGAHTGTQVAATDFVKPLAEVPERPRIEVLAKLREVDSFNGALRRAGVGVGDVAEAALLIAAHTDVTSLQPGTPIDIVLGRRTDKSEPRPLESLSFRAAFDLRLDVERNAAGEFVVKRVPIAIDETPLRVHGEVGSSLYKSARAAGLSSRVVANYIRALSPRVDFQRDVMASHEFDLVVEHKRAATGETQTGDVLYARLDGEKELELVLWEAGGKEQYFLPDGSSVKAGMISDPVSGARISSNFGMRHHPVLGRTRMHKGIDYAAVSGTPVEAAASGKVIFAGRNGGYGNHVRIRHANGIVTSYSHLKGFAKGVRSGANVEQGEVIAYVGSTGMSTGPHLHYEVMVGGRAVNPRSTELPTGYQLTGGELRRFKETLERLRQTPMQTAAKSDSTEQKS